MIHLLQLPVQKKTVMQLVAYVMPGMPHGMLSKMGVLASAQSRSGWQISTPDFRRCYCMYCLFAAR